MTKTRFEVQPGVEALRKRGRMTAVAAPAAAKADGTRFCHPGEGGFGPPPQAAPKPSRRRHGK